MTTITNKDDIANLIIKIKVVINIMMNKDTLVNNSYLRTVTVFRVAPINRNCAHH